MTANILFPLLVAIVGAIVYALCTTGPVQSRAAELGKIAFLAGMIALCFQLATHAIHF